MNRSITTQLPHTQRGFVLIVSMMILMVITMVGVTAISTSTLEGRMAHNLQHTMYAFQAAESIIEDTIRASDSSDPAWIEANDPSIIAINQGIGAPLVLNPNMANYQAPLGAGVLLSPAGTTITTTGPGGVCPGGNSVTDYTCTPMQINAVVTINTSNASVNHIQGIRRMRPKPSGS